MEDVCVIVPVYNEASTVAVTVSDLLQRFEHVVCVDDGSDDGSADLANAAGATVVRHAVNLGQGAALRTGFDYVLRHTTASYAVTFDADGQHLVDDAHRMLERARLAGTDVMLASRFTGCARQMPLSRELILRAAVRLTRATSQLEVTDTHNGLRVLSRRALERIDLRMPRMAYASELLDAIVPAGLTYLEEPVTVIYTAYSRAKGQKNSNAFNIVFDLAVNRLRAAR
jgi:glycosyltransferase involved in cell wall biosynthesis